MQVLLFYAFDTGVNTAQNLRKKMAEVVYDDDRHSSTVHLHYLSIGDALDRLSVARVG